MFNPDDFMKSLKIELSCDCGHKIRKSIRWLKNNKTLGCPACHATIDLLGNKTIAKALKPLD